MRFILCEKLFSFFRYLNFCPELSVMEENGLIKKVTLISKFMLSQTGKQIIPIHILSNISRSKSNQAMKYGQLIQYNVRYIFLQKSCRK